MDVAVTLKCLYLRAFILSLVVIPKAAICERRQEVRNANGNTDRKWRSYADSSKCGTSRVDPDLIQLTHDEHRHPHEVEDAVEEHPEHPGRAGGDLGQIEPEPILRVSGGAVDPPI